MSITTRGFELVPWQVDAVDSWRKGCDQPFTGVLEVFTGGGKTLLAITAMSVAAQIEPDLKVAIVAPTEALARQWILMVAKFTDIPAGQIGLMGAGGKGDLHKLRVLVCVLNSASKKLPAMAADIVPVMLVVDECHRAGAPAFAKVLDTPAKFRMGLSATPDREELDAHGEPLAFDEQRVGMALGGVVYRFSLKDARKIGWLPDYKIHHHGITLDAEEQSKYRELSRRVDDVVEKMRQFGVDPARAFNMQGQPGEIGDAARAYMGATTQRKDFLYRAKDRSRVAARIVAKAMEGRERRVLLFHERKDEAADLHQQLGALLPETRVLLEHSGLSDSVRKAALAEFRTGSAPVLVSVKSLIEGIDVPEADVGVSVASSASVRQRIQALGRVLRRTFDDKSTVAKVAEMHVLYVAKTVDESIYEKEDWGDLTGDSQNSYWLYSNGLATEPVMQDGPPATPRPTEEQEWQRHGQQAPAEPVLWQAAFAGQEYSVDTLGNVHNLQGTTIANPQGVSAMVKAVRGRPGGKFRVTPVYRLVLVASDGKERDGIWMAGQLATPFTAQAELMQADSAAVNVEALRPGDLYPGPANAEHGSFQIRQKLGGRIQIKKKKGEEVMFALTNSEAHPQLAENALRLLEAWKSVLGRGLTVKVNGLDHVWYEVDGERRFLAVVSGGFVWPQKC